MPTVSILSSRFSFARLARAAAAVVTVGVVATLVACEGGDAPLVPNGGQGAVAGTPALRRQYGVPVKVGNGRARSYVVLDGKQGVPVEVGVALDQTALDNLPAPMPMPAGSGHEHYHQYVLQLPAGHGTPYQFVELDWNPSGHGYPYEAPHFDFHFYRISLAERNAIDPTDPAWTTKAANLPAPDYIPAGYISSHLLAGTTPGEVSVPRMGLHWLDLASSELPPQSLPFTATYIIGTWDGRVIFDEPMITRAFILAQGGNETVATTGFAKPIPTAAHSLPAGRYPSGYAVNYDARAREYRIALTTLTPRD